VASSVGKALRLGDRSRRADGVSPRLFGRHQGANPTRSELTVHRQLELDQSPPRPNLNEPLLTPQEAAALLAVRVSWIYDAVRGDRLPCVRVGRHVRFLRTDLERWIADQRG